MSRARSALLLFGLAACNVFGYRPTWIENDYPSVRFDDAFDVAVEAIDRDYDLVKVERETGHLETKWSDASISAFERRSTRAKVHAEVTGGRGQPVVVKIRVERESSRVNSVFREHESDDDWESYPDDADEAQRLMTNVHLVLHEFGASPALKQRLQHAQENERRKP